MLDVSGAVSASFVLLSGHFNSNTIMKTRSARVETPRLQGMQNCFYAAGFCDEKSLNAFAVYQNSHQLRIGHVTALQP